MSSVADLFASIIAQRVRVAACGAAFARSGAAAVFLPFPFPFARP
jgi:hypothetical protein